ncbi:MAG: hypothetical protein AAF292_03090 [Pseudomonadota bacterium]
MPIVILPSRTSSFAIVNFREVNITFLYVGVETDDALAERIEF